MTGILLFVLGIICLLAGMIILIIKLYKNNKSDNISFEIMLIIIGIILMITYCGLVTNNIILPILK